MALLRIEREIWVMCGQADALVGTVKVTLQPDAASTAPSATAQEVDLQLVLADSGRHAM